jgi:hypothetical protein
MFEKTNFTSFIKNAFSVGGNSILRDDEEQVSNQAEEVLEDD